MSMNGEYLRVTPAELLRAVRDPEWAMGFADEAMDDASSARHLTTDKAWNAIAFLLDRAGFPVDVVHGERSFADDADWGYGPPHYLPAIRVQLAAEALAATDFARLTAGVTAADLAAADIYPSVWGEPDALDWVQHQFELLMPFFAKAAAEGDAMLLWLD